MKRIAMKRENENIYCIDAFSKFIRHCKIKNLSERTIKYYEECLNVFNKFIDINKLSVKDLDRDLIENYILFLKEQDIKNVTVNTRLRGIRAFIYWCMERGYIDNYKISLIKQEEIIKETFTTDEIKLLLEKPSINKCSFAKYRNWGMINFLLGTGVRLSTLISIRIVDIDLHNSSFRTRHNKNGRQQIIPISRTLNKVLTEYLTYRNHESDDEVLFCTQFGKPFTSEGARNAIVTYGEQKGIMKCGAHKFRHTFAKNWILAGGDVFRLQKILGHSSMDVVRKYVNIYGKDLQKDFNRFNVLEQLSDNKSFISLK